ncbi:tripartite motif-containing protein 16-like [Megalobrama amblycephala]|uniref:tripartite motif-containing protein 16-like n=1 Tax=Megalobrama amblycephala TaxID=75352 RepID=UPI0020143910|nr:tripartite motif-containing protein 16-like [Megalobrama amblycephala]
MAEASVLWAREQFICPVCLDLLKDPVTIPCGHNYCMTCITDCWNHQDQKTVHICPQCRQTFAPRPALNKNTMLAEVVEKLKKTGVDTGLEGARATDVKCDVCTGRKHKAIKSCLVCLNSYCQNHLEQHENLFKGKRHYLMDATGQLQEMICSQHGRLLEVFCRTDQHCICTLCTMDKHKNHDIVPTEAERTEKERNLKKTQINYQQRIQEREKNIQELREAVECHKRSAQAAVKDSERIFTEIIRSIKGNRSEVTRLIRDQEKAAVSQAEGLLQRLEQEIADLRRRHAELEQLSHTDDHIHFLQGFQYLSAPLEPTKRITVTSPRSTNDIRQSICQLKEKIENFCKEEIQKISVKHISVVLRTRKDFLQYAHQFTLDPNTANKHIRLLEKNRVATYTDTVQRYSDHPHRFDVYYQVMCGESVSERCYWEVEWKGDVGISVSYKHISRKGTNTKCLFGYNDHSWSLFCSPSRYSFRHNDMETDIPAASICSRIGVYVDHSAGTLSFYGISDTMTLICRAQATFTQPLYPGFRLYNGSTVKLCDLTI